MTHLKGTVTGDIKRIPRSLHRMALRQVRSWIEKQPDARGSRSAQFRVVFSKADRGHWVTCQTEIKFGDETWRGIVVSQGFRGALSKSIDRLAMVHKAPPRTLIESTSAWAVCPVPS